MVTSENVVTQLELDGVKFLKRGKVRDIFDLGDRYLMVASDRISCFDVVLPTGIPGKGRVLTSLSVFWFDFFKDLISNHLITAGASEFPKGLEADIEKLKGRSMLVKKAEPLPVECVVRGYLAGSGWKDYQKTRGICGIDLPAGLKESEKLPEPIFTPSTKEDTGHDISISYENVEELIGEVPAAKIKAYSLELYQRAADYALNNGIIIADTKFEFGRIDDEIILIDEVLTPDSSRFWPVEGYEPGKSQSSFDKQYVRDYLETLDWDKTPPGPELPDSVVSKTTEKYAQAQAMLVSEQD